jgi:hypothetical protein
MTAFGSHCHGVLLNKDYFYGKKESDALMIAYTSDVLHLQRIEPTALIPDAAIVFDQFREIHDLIDVPLYTGNSQTNIGITQGLLSELQVKSEIDRLGYETFTIYHPNITSVWLTGIHTRSVHNIEKITFNADSLEQIEALIIFLSILVKTYQVEYVEWWISANKPEVQHLMKRSNFKVFGYVPAWLKTQSGFQDAIIFGWTKIMPELNAIQLIPEGSNLLNRLNI